MTRRINKFPAPGGCHPAGPRLSRTPVLSLFSTLVLVLVCAALPLAHGQTEQEKTREELKALEADIKRIAGQITEDTNRQSKLQAQLRDTEKELGQLQREIREKQDALRSGKKELASLETRLGEQEAIRDQQQARIALELRTAWQTGRQGQVKVLLNQESPHTVARSMAYYRYFFDARNELLEEYSQTLAELAALQAQIQETIAKLESQRKSLEKRQGELATTQARRQEVVARLADDIDSNSARLKQKEQDRLRLEDLLRAIGEAVVDMAVPQQYQAFGNARGAMPWPVAGKPSNRFNRKRNAGMRWQGLNIPAEQGTLVRAIHHGRVVYSDWLRGSGLLLIVDHGDGYMSLYAHNESLLRDVGEWVSAGDAVSTVGNSGGADDYGLYFEIRRDGKPVNPSDWCRG